MNNPQNPVQIQMNHLRSTTIADLEKIGFVCCEAPADYDDTLGGNYLFMNSPSDEIFIVSQDSAQNLRTDEMIDTKTGQPLKQKGPPYSRGFRTPSPQPK